LTINASHGSNNTPGIADFVDTTIVYDVGTQVAPRSIVGTRPPPTKASCKHCCEVDATASAMLLLVTRRLNTVSSRCCSNQSIRVDAKRCTWETLTTVSSHIAATTQLNHVVGRQTVSINSSQNNLHCATKTHALCKHQHLPNHLVGFWDCTGTNQLSLHTGLSQLKSALHPQA
jgi:hypothetical protein